VEELSRPYGTTRGFYTLPRISSWATFSRPFGTGSLFLLTGVTVLAANSSTLTLAEVKNLIWTGVGLVGDLTPELIDLPANDLGVKFCGLCNTLGCRLRP
jgi:hypothetical protein